jgi:hypothetical protein
VLAERVEDRREAVAGDERLRGFANGGAGLLCLGDDAVDVLALQRDGNGGGGVRIDRGDLVGLGGVPPGPSIRSTSLAPNAEA